MYFNGGMVPTYLIVKEVGLLDSVWSLIIPGLISTYYVIILRTSLIGIPKEMTESAELDGANEFTTLIRILIPLIMPTMPPSACLSWWGIGTAGPAPCSISRITRRCPCRWFCGRSW